MREHDFPGYMPQDKWQWYTPRTYLEFKAGHAKSMAGIYKCMVEQYPERTFCYALIAKYQRKRLYLLRGLSNLT